MDNAGDTPNPPHLLCTDKTTSHIADFLTFCRFMSAFAERKLRTRNARLYAASARPVTASFSGASRISLERPRSFSVL